MKSSKQILDREFLELRSKLLDIAASIDRIDRAAVADKSEGSPSPVTEDYRMRLLAKAIEIIASGTDTADRAYQIQHLFSREFDPQWKQKFKLPTRN